ncbi:MAG: threonine-phosphate decarboxylase CobD [Candidatus Omnitrophota bacterium]|nr:threonine-phosphate decarboxylase CobD [Candidatus Omnitrophota bacterium]
MMIKTNHSHGGNIHYYINNTSLPSKKMIDFSANINPLGLPKSVKETIIKNIKMITHYPQPHSDQLKIKLAAFHKINRNNLITGNGSIDLIYLIPRALRIKTGLIITPTFSEYETALQLNNARTIFFNVWKQNNFTIDESTLIPLIKKADLVFLCNPNNPTGTILFRDKILNLLNVCREYNTFLVIDETFMNFAKAESRFSLLAEAPKYKNLIILRSLTKFFAFAGLRLGYAVGNRETIKLLSQYQYPWNINFLAQIAGQKVIEETSYIKKSKDFIQKEKEYLYHQLNRIEGLKMYPPNVNFILGNLKSNAKIKNVKTLSEKMAKKGILIRDCSNFRGLNNTFFRVAVKTRRQNEQLVRLLKSILI